MARTFRLSDHEQQALEHRAKVASATDLIVDVHAEAIERLGR